MGKLNIQYFYEFFTSILYLKFINGTYYYLDTLIYYYLYFLDISRLEVMLKI